MTKLTNAFGSLTAILAVISGIMTQVLQCVPGAGDLTAVCTAPWLGQYAGVAALVFGGIALVQKLMRPGGILRSLFGTTAVVVPASSPKSVAGTVTPEQVAQP